MKNTTLILGAIALLSACGSPNDPDKLSKKKTERDSLKVEYTKTGKALASVEAWIAKNDPDLKRNVPLVTIVNVSNKTFEHYLEVHGTAESQKNAVIYPNTQGNVRKVLVSEGQQVSKGQKLVDIDSDIIKRQIAEVETNYELAKTTYERQKKLWDQNIGSEMQYLQAKSRKEALEASLETLREQERMTEIRAPFKGSVDEVFLNVGELANPSMPIVRIVELSEMRIEADVSEAHINRINVGDPVQVTFESLGLEFTSIIEYKGQFINPNNRTFKIWVDVPEGTNVLPNALSKVKIRDFAQDSATVVPTRLIQEDGQGRSFLYALNNSEGEERAKKVFVERVMSYGVESMISTGNGELNGSAALIDEGARLVVDGQQVRLADEVANENAN